MPRTTIIYAILMILIGVVGYGISPVPKSFTALIPAAIGIPVLLFGILASREILRKHLMHVSVLLAIIAVIAGGKRIVIQLSSYSSEGHLPNPFAFTMISIMVGVSLAYTILCIRSFVVARLLRK